MQWMDDAPVELIRLHGLVAKLQTENKILKQKTGICSEEENQEEDSAKAG